MLSINIDGLGKEPQFDVIPRAVNEIEVSISWQLYIYIPEYVHLHSRVHTDRQTCMPVGMQAYKQVNSTKKALRMVTIVYNKYTCQTCLASLSQLSVMWIYEACWAYTRSSTSMSSRVTLMGGGSHTLIEANASTEQKCLQLDKDKTIQQVFHCCSPIFCTLVSPKVAL